MNYDLFVSYRRKDAARVLELVSLLVTRHSVRVWIDQQAIESFESSTQAIANGLASSRALLVWYSNAYPESRPCQWELSSAFIAAQRLGPVRDRILVANPEATNQHIHPLELRDQNYQAVESSSVDLTRTAAKIAAQLATLDDRPLGAGRLLLRPAWYGRAPLGSNRFVGRIPELWRMHSALFPQEHAIVSDRTVALCQVRGLGGQGKSLIAEEYALRFGGSFPAGVFWLTAPGPSSERGATIAGQRQALLHAQFQSVAVGLGVTADELKTPERVRAAITSKLAVLTNGGVENAPALPLLWIVDDLPDGLSREEISAWLCPHPAGKTLLTTRSREYGAFGTAIDLGVLDSSDAIRLLAIHRKPADESEAQAAQSLAHDLGCHAMAIEIAGAMLASSDGLISYAGYRRQLAHPSDDVLELAASLADALPTGHAPSVVSTFSSSIAALGTEGLDFLRLASVLSSVPIPVRVVSRVIALADLLDDDQALARTLAAFKQCERLSLVDRVETHPHARAVHALVCRTLRFMDKEQQRQIDLRRCAVEALNEELPRVADVRAHAELTFHVEHARTLGAHSTLDGEVTQLVGWLARYELERGGYEEALPLSQTYIDMATALEGAVGERTLLAWGDRARLLKAIDRLDEAREIEELVLAERTRILGAEHLDTMTAMNNLAGTLTALGRHTEALTLAQAVLEMRQRLLGDEHPHTLFSLNNVGGTLLSLNRHNEARHYLQLAYSGRKQVMGGDHADTLVSMANLSSALRGVGAVAEANALVQALVEARRRVLGVRHPRTLSTIATWGATLIAEQSYEAARQLLLPAHEQALLALGEDDATTLLLANNLARAAFFLGEHVVARPLQQRAFERQKARFGPRNAFTLKYALNLYELLCAAGESAAAQAHYDDELAWLATADESQLGQDELEMRTKLLVLARTRPTDQS